MYIQKLGDNIAIDEFDWFEYLVEKSRAKYGTEPEDAESTLSNMIRHHIFERFQMENIKVLGRRKMVCISL